MYNTFSTEFNQLPMINHNNSPLRRLAEGLAITAAASAALSACDIESSEPGEPLAVVSLSPQQLDRLDSAAKDRVMHEVESAKQTLAGLDNPSSYRFTDQEGHGFSYELSQQKKTVNTLTGETLILDLDPGMVVDQSYDIDGTRVDVGIRDQQNCKTNESPSEYVNEDDGCPYTIFDNSSVWLSFTNPSKQYDGKLATNAQLAAYLHDKNTHLLQIESSAGIAREIFHIDNAAQKLSVDEAESSPLGDVRGRGDPSDRAVIDEVNAVIADHVTQTYFGH
ncbi:hypothetical protein KDA23_03255 [Candidatus Saccharibacteria bacterium]|nr:hypothetical protein [Candidatus Saccharibacteria bacterium]